MSIFTPEEVEVAEVMLGLSVVDFDLVSQQLLSSHAPSTQVAFNQMADAEGKGKKKRKKGEKKREKKVK